MSTDDTSRRLHGVLLSDMTGFSRLMGEDEARVFFNDTPTTEIYTVSDTLSLHDALPISRVRVELAAGDRGAARVGGPARRLRANRAARARADPALRPAPQPDRRLERRVHG